MIRKILIILLVLFFIIYPSGLLLRFRIAQNIYIVPQDIIALLLFVFTVVHIVIDRKIIRYKKFIVLQLIFIFLGVLSLFINYFLNRDINLLISLLYVLRYITYVSLIYTAYIVSKFKKPHSLILYSGLAVLFIGFLQFFFYNNLRNLFYLGWDDHLYRLFSSFLDPNFAGLFYVLFFFFLLNDVLVHKLRNSYWQLIFSFFTLIAVYLTYSRTALVALVAGIITLGLIRKKFKALIIVIVVLVFFLFVFSDVKVEGLNPLRTASTNERIESIEKVSQIISKNAIYGVGFNAFRYAQLRYGFRNLTGTTRSNADAGTDNSFLFVFATTGIIGLIAFLLSYFFLWVNIFKEKTITSLILCSMLISFFVGSLFINALFYTPILSFIILAIGFENSKNA